MVGEKVKDRDALEGRHMATYGYKAITKAGKEVKGSLEADNKDLAMAELRRQELTVIDLGEQSFLTKDIDIQIGGWPKARDLSVMCRQFVSMTKAGVSILESLKMLCEQTENKRLQDALKEVRISVEKGETLADSMAEHPKVFPGIMVNMVAAGEASGSLETALDRVAVQLEKSHKTQAMVKKAMIYPIAVCIVAIIVTIVMLVKVIPSYEEMFSQIGGELPWITQFYVNLSHAIINYWFIIVPVIIAIVMGIKYFAKTDLGKHVFGKIAIKIPIFGKLTVKTASSMMARTMSTLLGAGVPLIEAVERAVRHRPTPRQHSRRQRKMKVKKSEIQLLIAVIGVLIAVCTYFLVYSSFNEKSDALEAQNVTLSSQVATLEILDQRKADYIEATGKMQSYITNFENRFPADILPEDSIMMVKTLEDYTRTEVANIAFGSEAEVVYTPAADAATTTADATAATDTTTTDAAATTTTASTSPVSTDGTAYADTHMYEVPLSISISCTYDDFKGLVRYIYNQQERESIQGVSISYNETDGMLTGNMTMNTYYLLGTDKVYSSPYIPDMQMGVDTIFGNVE